MAALGDLGGRVKGSLAGAGTAVADGARATAEGIAAVVEDRPALELPEVDFPYRFPTREEPLALALFWALVLSLAVVLSVVPTAMLLYDGAPAALLWGLGIAALAVGVLANLNLVGRAVQEEASQMLRPLAGAGIPVLDALHFWLNPLAVVLVAAFTIAHSSNNYMMHAAAATLVAWALAGLMLKLPRESAWNGPMLQRWAGRMHRTPFVYVAIVAFVFVGLAADWIY